MRPNQIEVLPYSSVERRKLLAVLGGEAVAHYGIVAQERQPRCRFDEDGTLPLEHLWKSALEESGQVTKLRTEVGMHIAGNGAQPFGVDFDDARIEQLLVCRGDRLIGPKQNVKPMPGRAELGVASTL